MDRRDFLTRTTFAAAAAAASSLQKSSHAATIGLQPAPSSSWAKRTLVYEQKISENARVQSFTSPAEPLSGSAWRIWMSTSGANHPEFNVGYLEGTPGEELKVQWAVLSTGAPADAPLSLGGLPSGWHPKQGVHLRLKDGRHRLYFWAHGEGIVRYLAADSEDGRRYTIVNALSPCIYHPADRTVDGTEAVKAGFSRMAKRKAKVAAGESLAPAALITNDATNVYQLPDGSFELYTAALMEVGKDDPRYMPHDNIPGRIRVIDRFTSEDGLRWENRKRVIQADAQDHTDLQHYYLAVTHTEKGRIGMLGHYRLQAQTMDIEWCHSEDGVQWHRPARTSWLPRSEPHTLPDSYGVYAPHNLVQHNGRWHLFYTGTNDAHNHKDSHGPYRRAIFHTSIDSPWQV
ncbi:hypothetical protein DES53_10226 [Roseimicrobium gellanilyticum]|uniref:Uncharacterized protein n=1 Tax=Roseimicrobium gellanilyticum TaxID=748857 RepID=A0A366HRU0_9BACT|nr:hypothetical protein [Roseimicrobium gellanilyticum]RBP45644.1 hypothetical protein DES53_10226 [Roseimicrobium gellanilyticum]